MTDKPKRLNRQQRREQTRRDLIKAAGEVFAKRGFHAASVDEIAEQAGYSKGAVYSNFDSKEDLFVALMEAYNQMRLQAATIQISTAAKTVDERIQLGAKTLAALVRADRQVLQLTVEYWSNASREPGLRKKLSAYEKKSSAGVAALIERQLQDLNLTPALPVDQVTETLMALADGFFLRRSLDPDRFPASFYEKAFAIVLRALLVTEKASS